MSEVWAPEDLLREEEGGLTTDTLTRGTRLGRYELLLPIAMGGMAKVWAARQRGQRGFSKLVAIKTILPNLSEDPAFESMFLDEARIASNVHHPNVCDIYELGEEGKVLYLAMEWVNGDSLVRVLRASGSVSERIDPRIAARIIADACAGVHAAHELVDDIGRPLGVVHRDMSPHNILLSADGNVKVTDFGVAKAIGQLHDQTSTGVLKGKVNYMAPEQITGTHIDRRSDVFALGCVLYEATTGHLPFRVRGELDHQVMQRIMNGQCTPPSQVTPGYPRELDAIVMRSIANQPIQRFASAERMRMALEEWLQMSGPIVTQSHVAATVRARVGQSIDARRERIRVAMSTTGPHEDTNATPNPSASGVVSVGTGVGAASGDNAGPKSMRRPPLEMSPLSQPLFVPLAGPPIAEPVPVVAPAAVAPTSGAVPDAAAGPAMAAAQDPHPPATAQYLLAAAIGVSVAFVLGAGAFFVWHSTRPAEVAVPLPSPAVSVIVVPGAPPGVTGAIVSSRPPLDPATAAPEVAPSAAVAPSPREEPAPAAPTTGELTEQTAPAETVVLNIPDGAAILVDGVALGDGAHALPRPRPGQTVSLVVRQAGYDDAVLSLDASTSSPVLVTLRKHRHHNEPAIPANPY